MFNIRGCNQACVGKHLKEETGNSSKESLWQHLREQLYAMFGLLGKELELFRKVNVHIETLVVQNQKICRQDRSLEVVQMSP